ncbi:protein geranylgeranyltransferase type I subunit CDC43 [Sporobolomyces salmoneus]|uniref:protein geranylgeranyltransferase type I subunit CDC43 n=1 Tax=Sporobolomyces salmoneus TaxID=183962 RepID=UPI00317AE683
MDSFRSKQHVLFSLRHAKYLPTPYEPEDSNRMTLGYFCLSSLALLPCPSTASTPTPPEEERNVRSASSSSRQRPAALQTMLRPIQRQGLIDWVYEQQLSTGGFRGSDSIGSSFVVSSSSTIASSSRATLDPPNIIQSYTAILILALLEDPLERLDRSGLLRLVGECQNSDGSFSLFPGSAEPGDPRSTYSAFAICSLLNDWSTIDTENGLRFLDSCRSYEGGFAQRPHAEANAGPTYCAIASYVLSSRLPSLPSQPSLLRWLLHRQIPPTAPLRPSSPSSIPSSRDTEDSEEGEEEEDEDERHLPPMTECAGFQGRTNKPLDACYSFWSLASLRLLLEKNDFEELVETRKNSNWLLNCQHPLYGGIAREKGALPDVYHTYLSLAALSIGQPTSSSSEAGAEEGEQEEEEEKEDERRGMELGLRELDVAWNVEMTVAERFRDRIKGLQERDRGD